METGLAQQWGRVPNTSKPGRERHGIREWAGNRAEQAEGGERKVGIEVEGSSNLKVSLDTRRFGMGSGDSRSVE